MKSIFEFLGDALLPARVFRFFIHRFQRIRGIPRLAWLTRRVFLPARANLVLVETPEGLPVSISPNDYGQIMHFYFSYCPELQALLKDLLVPGDICLDLGSNTGLLSVLMSELVGSTGLVLAVDPNPDNIQLIKNTIESHNISNILAVQAAVAGHNGTVRFAIPQGANSESGDIRPDRETGLEVCALTVDTLLAGNISNRVCSFIKVDIEGAEAELLESLQTVFHMGQRPILLVEFHPSKIGRWQRDPHYIRETLWGLGYEKRHVLKSKDGYILRNDRSPLISNANLLFFEPGQPDRRLALRKEKLTIN